MDLFDLLLHAGTITAALVAYLIFFKKSITKKGEYRVPGWNYPLKLLAARFYGVPRWKAQLTKQPMSELPREDLHDGWDSFSIRTVSPDGVILLLEIRKLCRRRPLAEVVVHVTLADGVTYKLPRHPDTIIGAWESIPDGWSAGGLKMIVLEPETRLRILYNGLLTRDDGTTLHAKINFIWCTASDATRHPEDWSPQLAARALALEPWREADWYCMLGKYEEGGWSQWGTVQGRFECYERSGAVSRSEYVRTRGLRERRWAPRGHSALRRSLAITAVAADGTAVCIRAAGHRNVLTQCIFGSIRFPDTSVRSITSTNLNLPDFCETPDSLPDVFTLNVSSGNRDLRLVVRPKNVGGKLVNGMPYSHEVRYNALALDIDGEAAVGILELGYPPSVIKEPEVPLTPPAELKWVEEAQTGPVGYCVFLEQAACACPGLVGGKGASLALLASVQLAEGYRVPPAFCLTVKALEKHLEMNPQLLDAVRQIEAANEDYNENNFKEKCAKAAELFTTTAIKGEILEQILMSLVELRRRAAKEDLGPERQFAVRSSAVGEDSETLSAAGQNETILGCVSDADVVRAVQKCWGSMFAFTSAYYRRQNGQACVCGAGVVVQALVAPRAAGVMFTRHPAAGDPSRLLLTANYGLGESVVSGTVDPDTIVVSRGLDDSLSILTTELGAKATRVTTTEEGVTSEEVPESERRVSCLSEREILRLARVGVAQEQLWGAPRDIEWAIAKNDVFLLQARPITSLERWTEEELLHELDTPIMADDELTTFANCGEVFPKPVSPLSYDMVLWPLAKSLKSTVGSDVGNYEDTIALTHNRCALALYNSVYRRPPRELDVHIRMIEMSIHGHPVATERELRVAARRRPPRATDRLAMLGYLTKCLALSKWYMKDTIKKVNQMNLSSNSEDPIRVLQSITDHVGTMSRLSYNHGLTSSASTGSQLIAMSVLLEGGSDFTSDHCNEICTLLNSGDVLSAEVPLGLARLARAIDQSGRAGEFRTQDPGQALIWLRKNLPEVHLDVCEFLEQHGHRAIMEFDMLTKPWALVPEELMKILQTVQITKEETQNTKTDAEVIKSLTTPKKSSTRKILSWVLPLCRRTVRHREATKAHLILGVHKLRVAAIQLGRLLVRRWYLPHHDLVFFFRVAELRKYIETRDPALLRKAMQRQQYYPGWCKLKFSELNYGWVEPLAAAGALVQSAGARLEAVSVCGGDVVARACVVKDLAEIGELKQGDILITYATDIGWSPYFPLLSGIVTELGGLISHGAVIAREYGLPCIVGATHATDLFKTGDMVRLSGSTGVIEKVHITADSKEQDSEN